MTTVTQLSRRSSVLRMADGGIHFDGVKAVDGVSIEVRSGEVLGLIGPNGSGKTSTLNLLSGMLRATSGTIWLDDVNLTRHSMRQRARRGVVRTFQSGRVFGRLTVRENVEAAALGAGLRRREARALTEEILEELALDGVAQDRAEQLTAGRVRTTAIARALAARPRFLLLDEPAAGQNETEAVELITAIRGFAQRRECGVLLVEHDMSVVMGTCDRLHVLDSGRTVIEGEPAAVRSDPQVIEIYFGKRH
ncbi:ABC transporter ATP-binding protein [Nocardioides sp. WV_118_6]|uniref:ABC transporter ATP-binding protein n=1 Tax=Pimelobacter TaxID=2044 RepID=UPI001C04C9FC|nr:MULTISPECIES: ABC transporter ATP-binding protein [Pimelobacter]MBU2693634.1 ABC transporter ATP-binding protein [Pimelobacter sp. 30-1]UUW90812.1 ABC transporter ATP-binding protein [Pimelobacter simplex]UUW94641.1 ABC transporter ATP-binding protein [Pimelobacter simplex]